MEEYLFCFTAEAVAQDETGFRPGARHALMLWITASDEQTARARGVSAVEDKGWLLPRITRGTQICDPDLIEDDVLRQAAESALTDGAAIVVYADEMTADG
ncbi:hypothetical protein [Novosphingobium jiangmenense]|uniref:Uncharacterized protein n=1 Tax=Novosphingobium jiangmenense TaxID=2791981 RepID=A0ABS0HIQ7_9SPHN|nr:hypothetical protein [Novosphingobium jiangmenense]MBF9151866.1 hypothetical protein [Novosphingobium jiangmenense]